ncbi:MAG: ion transporter [Agathobacter sp.]|nr:ion transporter [Agathobacter sp.]
MNTKAWNKKRKRVFEIIEVGSSLDVTSRIYDFINVGAIVLNLIASIMFTFDTLSLKYGTVLWIIEVVTLVFFMVDYVLRLWTADYLHPRKKKWQSICKYALSITGLIDLLSFLPYLLPVVFPGGAVAFRMIRIVRIFRLFRINAYYDALSVITDVLRARKQQLISSVFIIVVLMLASSLCMYSLEHEAQPQVFSNAFSGIWWAASTLLTVGYGDIYPITMWGRILGILITFLGVGMVAIPTGIISAGFVEQYTTVKKKHEYGYEEDMNFIKVNVVANDPWVGKKIADLDMPVGVIITIIKRDKKMMIPRGDVVLQEGDSVILGAEPFEEKEHINLKEVVLREENPWCNQRIRDLDMSRHSIIVLIKRKNKALIPNGDMILRAGDRIFLYTQHHIKDASEYEI